MSDANKIKFFDGHLREIYSGTIAELEEELGLPVGEISRDGWAAVHVDANGAAYRTNGFRLIHVLSDSELAALRSV